jgi:hypothetical protein
MFYLTATVTGTLSKPPAVTTSGTALPGSRNMFLGILGHDLRSPIGAASVCAKLLVKTGSLSPTQSIQTPDRRMDTFQQGFHGELL